ncbi:hypothetical protein M1N83_00330 [Dehalococcoidia bacterium]|nr:hypothetical protein [Dehalococcoidia bacterium]
MLMSACSYAEARLTRGFLEYAQHRGFIADPTRPGHPKDKPKVKRQVPYARERFFKGGQFHDLQDLRQQASRWCLEIAGQRVHRRSSSRDIEK